MNGLPLPINVALVDIGTNTLKYSVMQVLEDQSVQVLDSWAETVRIGAGLAESGVLAPERIELALESLSRSAERARESGATEFIGVGTEAIRRASNGDDLTSRIADWEIRIISGNEEAGLAFRGLQPFLSPTGTTLIADIGGGSSELIQATNGQMTGAVSLPVGSTVLADRYFQHEPPTVAEVANVRRTARMVLTGASTFHATSPETLILSGGNGVFLQMLSVSLGYGSSLSTTNIEAILGHLSQLPTDDVAARLSISSERAKVFPAGIAIALEVADRSGAQTIEAHPSGIRNGLLLAWLHKRFPGETFHIQDETAQAD